MVKFYKKQGNELVTLENFETNCWVNISAPFDHEKLKQYCEQFSIPFDFLIDSLDVDERSRFETEDDVKLIVINTPVVNDVIDDGDAPYITMPIGIVIKPDMILTISPFDNPVVDSFLSNRMKNFDIDNKELFILQLFDKTVLYFLHFLKEINKKRNLFEKELYHSMRNEELSNLLNIQKSLVYFMNTIRSNELLMMKIQRTDFLRISDKEDEVDMLQDTIVDCSQASEMANVYTNILNGTMDAFASIISNNLNFVMKRLTSVTIVLMVPTLVASFYGMNVSLPMGDHPYAFVITLMVSIVLAVILITFFLRKRWF